MFHTLALIHNHCLCLVVDSGQLPPNRRWLGNDWEKSEKKPISPFQQNIDNMYQVNYLQMLYQRNKSTRILRRTISYLLCLSLVWTLNKKCQTTYAVFYDRNFAYIFFYWVFVISYVENMWVQSWVSSWANWTLKWIIISPIIFALFLVRVFSCMNRVAPRIFFF